jgi:tetratricopeptide (TPR) repeat protein
MSWPTARAQAAGGAAPHRPARQLLIVGSLPIYWERGYQHEITEVLATLLAADGAGPASIERAKALNTGGFVLWSSNQLAAARAWLEESVHIAEALDDPLTLAFGLAFLGWTFDFLGDYDAAQAALERSVAIGQALGALGQHAAAIASSLMGDIPYRHGDLPAARRLYEDSIAFVRQIRNSNILTYPLRRLAYLALREGESEQAAELLSESLRLNRELDHLQGMCACLTGVAAVRLAQARPEQAAVLCGSVEAQLQHLGVPMYTVDSDEYERCAAQVKAALEPAALAAAWTAGRALTLEQSVEFALQP